RAAGVVQPDDRRTVAHREIHDLTDLFRERLGERSPEDGEVLREDVDETSVDAAVARDDAIAIELLLLETEVGRAVHDEPVELDERAFIEKKVEALARREFSFCVLRLHSRGTATLL